MKINDVQFNCDLEDIITELQSQLALNHIQLLQKKRDTSKDIMIQCPYHGNGQESNPSAGISKKDGTFHCFACNEVHSLQEVISHCFGHHEDAFGRWGWKWLNKNFSSVSVEYRKEIEIDCRRNTDVVTTHNDISYISEEELDSYRYFHPYMYKRRLTDEIIELFDIGYDKNTDCITFPIRDINGNTLFIARRSVKTKYFNYPQGVEKPLYGIYELYQLEQFPKEVIVCESMLDALTAWVYGKYAVALNGLGNELQFKQLRELSCRKLILATDNDDAGQKARKRIKEHIKNKIITEYQLPERKKDLNELEFTEFENLLEIF
jgi:DNA primase